MQLAVRSSGGGSSMTGFGSALRVERERCGYTLDAISTQTKVSVRHLEALEAEQFGALPGGVFRRGIVRAYLLAIGLEEEPWMQSFQGSLDAYTRASGESDSPGEQAWATFAENVRRSRPQPGGRSDLRWLGLLAMLILLAAAAWAAWHFVLQSRLR